MDRSVIAGVLAVDIADHVGSEERVVERRIEGVQLRGGAATDPEPAEQAFHWSVADDSHGRGTSPGLRCSGCAAALATLTKEMPTFMSTTRLLSVSKVTKAPQAAPWHDVLPGETTEPFQLPAVTNGRLNVRLEVEGVVGPGPAELTAGHLTDDRVPAHQVDAGR